MKKVNTVLLIIMIFTGALLFSSCSNSAGSNKISKSDNEIREIAYQSLTDNEKTSIIDWKGASVEKYKAETKHTIAGPTGPVNIKSKDTYKVTFKTNMDGLLGPIVVYLDSNSYKILGSDFRY